MAISTAILAFEGVQIIDDTGPYEAFGRRGPTYLVAQTGDALSTNSGSTRPLEFEARDPGSAADAPARQRVTVVRVGSTT
jgi:hypothetical protein